MSLRLKLLKKIAQTVPVTTTNSTVQTQTVTGQPKPFNPVSYYPSITLAFGRNVPFIIQLSNILNLGLYYTSNGATDLFWMYSQNFNFDMSSASNEDLKNLMGFAKQVHQFIFTNSGTLDKVALNAQNIADRIAPLKISKFIQNLSNTNPIGQLSAKIGGNIKTIINNLLLQIR